MGEYVTFRAKLDPASAATGDHSLSAYLFEPRDLTTSEQMFFFGAPLAHVQRYEYELRVERARRAAFRFRAHRHYASIADATH
jgi:hypothetical protein